MIHYHGEINSEIHFIFLLFQQRSKDLFRVLCALLYLQRHEQNQTTQKTVKSNSGWKTFQISKYIRDISCRAYYTRHVHCISVV